MRIGGGFAADRRFSLVPVDPVPLAVPAEPAIDPAEAAFDAGRAQGRLEAMEDARREEADRDAARGQIELAFARMNADALVELRDRLRQTVLTLCEETIAPLAIDPDGLALRVEKAAALLRRAQDEKRVLLHPDDFSLIAARLPAGLECAPDPDVERGALRIETADGGVEDGPAQWRRILAEAFREC
ncbi:FliH/SctL family protein [Croceibacterium sp. TMG7-5b_MA50]|uniref:FliH/SctL family protein n=1 Tax=Croceibacterium sp. TMG7-5b_MA50 TaxID=3121290 RepID=UPI0032215FC2